MGKLKTVDATGTKATVTKLDLTGLTHDYYVTGAALTVKGSNAGVSTITGGAGRDYIVAGKKGSVLIAGAGDTLVGGAGADVFVIDSAAEGGFIQKYTYNAAAAKSDVIRLADYTTGSSANPTVSVKGHLNGDVVITVIGDAPSEPDTSDDTPTTPTTPGTSENPPTDTPASGETEDPTTEPTTEGATGGTPSASDSDDTDGTATDTTLTTADASDDTSKDTTPTATDTTTSSKVSTITLVGMAGIAAKNTLRIVDSAGNEITGLSGKQYFYMPGGLDYKTVTLADNSTVEGAVIGADYEEDEFNVGYYKAATLIDASESAREGLTIKAGKSNSTIKAGSAGNAVYVQGGKDTVIAGAGSDTIAFATGEGANVVQGFDTENDYVLVYKGSLASGYTTTVEGGAGNLVLKAGNSTVTLEGKAGEAVNVIDAKGVVTRRLYGSNVKNAKNSLAYSDDIDVYAGNKNTYDLVKLSAGMELDISDTKKFVNVNGIDASAVSDSVSLIGGKAAATLLGGTASDILTLGKGGGLALAGGGDDTIYGGAGKDTFAFGNNDGTNTIVNYTAGKDVIKFTGASQSDLATVKAAVDTENVGDVTLTYGDTTVIVKDGLKKSLSIAGDEGVVNAKKGKGRVVIPAGDEATLTGLTYSDPAKKTKASLTEDFTASSFDANLYGLAAKAGQQSITEINASTMKTAVALTGNKNANKITGSAGGGTIRGAAGNDAITLTGGANVIAMGQNDGTDTVYNFKANRDSVVFDDGEGNEMPITGFSVARDSKNHKISLTLKSGKSSLVLKDIAENLTGVNYNSVTVTVNGAAQTFRYNTWSIGELGYARNPQYYYTADQYEAAAASGDRLKLSGTTVLDLSTEEAAAHYQGFKTLVGLSNANAGNISVVGGVSSFTTYDAGLGNVTIIGGKNTTLIDKTSGGGTNYFAAGSKACVIRGGNYQETIVGGTASTTIYGNSSYDTLPDTIICGSGKDLVILAASGLTRLENYDPKKDIIRFEGVSDFKFVDSLSKVSGELSNQVLYERLSEDGKDVIYTFRYKQSPSSGTGMVQHSVTVVGGANQAIKLQNGTGKKSVTRAVYTDLPTNAEYATKKGKTDYTAINLKDGFESTLDANLYSKTLTKIDASADKKAANIIGNAVKDTVLMGAGGGTVKGGAGNDAITLLAGEHQATVIDYEEGDGKDTVKNFASDIDVVKLYGAHEVTSSGANVLIKVGSGTTSTITLTGKADAKTKVRITEVTADGGATDETTGETTGGTTGGTTTETTTVNLIGNQSKANNFTFIGSSVTEGTGDDQKTLSVHYYGSTKKNDTLTVTGEDAATIDLSAENYHSIEVVNGTGAKGALTLTGAKGVASTLKGGSGDDTFICDRNGGVTTVWFAKGGGKDSVTGDSDDVIYLSGVKKISDVLLGVNDEGDKMTIALSEDDVLTINDWSPNSLNTIQVGKTKYKLVNDSGTATAVKKL